MVQQVEELRPKIQLVSFGEYGALGQEQVDDLQPRSLSRVPSQLTERVLLLDLQAIDVEPATRIALRGRELVIHPRNRVGRLKDTDPVVGLVVSRPNDKGETRGKATDPAHLPSLEELACKSRIEASLAEPYRKIVKHAGDKALALVETGPPSVRPDDVILALEIAPRRCPDRLPVVDRFADGQRTEQSQPARIALFDFDLKRVIERVRERSRVLER